MTEVSLFRLYVLRATYLLIVVAVGGMIFPAFISHPVPSSLMAGVVRCMLAGVWTLALIGIRYPLQILPLLLFETVWKAIWLVAIAWPLWSAHRIDADTAETLKACLMGVIIFPLAIPWPYVIANLVRKPADRWK